MDPFWSHLLAAAFPVIGGCLYVGRKFGEITQALKPLEGLPERVAAVEAVLQVKGSTRR